jgi:hypothetical protein
LYYHRYSVGPKYKLLLMTWMEVAVMAIGLLLSQNTFQKGVYNKDLSEEIL